MTLKLARHEEFRQAGRVGQTLNRRVHKTRVAQVGQADGPFFRGAAFFAAAIVAVRIVVALHGRRQRHGGARGGRGGRVRGGGGAAAGTRNAPRSLGSAGSRRASNDWCRGHDFFKWS
jgi:hypothetical protein